MLDESLRAFVEKELIPHEEQVERTDRLPPELAAEIRRKAMEAGFYAANMPEELGGGGLDNVSVALLERELGRANYALHWTVARPSNILRACRGEPVPHTPVWLMRQAGRYQAFYREIRSRLSFLELCHNPEAAPEVTVRATTELGTDAAILFADILLLYRSVFEQVVLAGMGKPDS